MTQGMTQGMTRDSGKGRKWKKQQLCVVRGNYTVIMMNYVDGNRRRRNRSGREKLFLFTGLFISYHLLLSLFTSNKELKETLLQNTNSVIRKENNIDIRSNNPSPNNNANNIRSMHPECFSESMFAFNNREITLVDIWRVMKYKLIGRDVKGSSERYNHICPWMKNRYNCASAQMKEYGQNAIDWKLVLSVDQHNDNNNNNNGDGGDTSLSKVCNLWDFVHDVGGPVGLGKYKQHEKQANNKTNKERTYNIVMFGNSFLRQIFQALVCGYGNQITNSLVQLYQTFGIDLKSMKERGERKFEVNELGELRDLLTSGKQKCDRYETLPKFYDINFKMDSIPQNCKDYSDNLAMVEFGGVIKFYFMFYPSNMANVPQIFDELWKLDPMDVDMLIFNVAEHNTFLKNENNQMLLKAFRETGVWNRKIHWPDSAFPTIQIRDLRSSGVNSGTRWFGANNPWIDQVPDRHPCMPGPPGKFILYYDVIHYQLQLSSCH